MKKIYTLIGAVVISSASIAQAQFAGKAIAKPMGTLPVNANKTTTATAGDTVTWNSTSGDFVPQFGQSGGLTRYGYTGGGELFGTNKDGLNICAQGYSNINQTSLVISKALVVVYEKHGTGTAGNIKVKLYSMAANKAWDESAPGSTVSAQNSPGPNTLLSSLTIPYANIDTTSLTSQIPNHFTIATFSVPVTVAKDFAIAVDASGMGTDTLGILADKDDAAINSLDYTFHYYNSRWYTTDFLFGGLNVNIGVFAVLDNGTAVKEFVNGAKLNAAYPNPSSDKATISYSLEKASSNVSLVVYDAKGQQVYNQAYGNQEAGDYKINLDASSYAAGSYFYQLRANGNSITKEFVVTK